LAWFTLGVTFTSGIGLLDGQPVTAAFRLCFTNEKLFGQTWDLPIVVTTIDIVLVWATPPAVSPSMRREDRWMTTDGSFFGITAQGTIITLQMTVFYGIMIFHDYSAGIPFIITHKA
jgi:hypothetical protein